VSSKTPAWPLTTDSSTELSDESDVDEGEPRGESAGETTAEFVMLETVESVVTVRWMADLGGRAVVEAIASMYDYVVVLCGGGGDGGKKRVKMAEVGDKINQVKDKSTKGLQGYRGKQR